MASIQGVYVALFGRPADPTGLNYFNGVTNNGADLTKIGDLAATQEYQDRFNGKTNVEIITSIYNSLFNRNPEQAGLDFFVNALATGTLNINNIAIAILDGAQGTDKTLVDKKIAAADLFTAALDQPNEIAAYQGNAAGAQGVTYLEAVTATSATPAAATADTAVAALLGGVTGQVFTLTTTVGESVIGTVGNDTFSAVVDAAGLGGTPPATLNNGDNVDGKDGVDTINILSGSAAATVPTSAIKNMEIVNLVSDTPGDSFAAGVANVNNFEGVQQLWQKGGAAAQDVLNVTNSVTAGFDSTVLVGGAGSVVAAAGAANDTVNVQLANVATGGTLEISETTVGGVKNAVVNGSVAGAGALTIDLDTATTNGTAPTTENMLSVGLSSSGTLTVTSSSLKILDMSASTGNLVQGGAVATVETLKGGSGNDTLLGGAASKLIEGGAGADTITGGNVAGEVINGGAQGTGAGNLFDAITLGAGGQAQTVITETGHSGLTATTIDQITNFITTEDKLDFNLAAGSATNFLAGGASSGVTDALTNANTAFDGTVQYFDTQVGADTFIFVDTNLDGTADLAVQLIGVGAIAFADIIA